MVSIRSVRYCPACADAWVCEDGETVQRCGCSDQRRAQAAMGVADADPARTWGADAQREIDILKYGERFVS